MAVSTSVRQFKFDVDKFRELMLYVAEQSFRDPKFGATKLNKILFYSDFLAYGLFGEPITGARYQRLTRGPAPRQLLPVQKRLIAKKEAVLVEHTYFNQEQRRLVPLRAPDLTLFTAEQISLVDRVINSYEEENATGISHLSHQEMAWRLAEDGQDIPYEFVFLSSQPPTPDDIKRGRELASVHGWRGVT